MKPCGRTKCEEIAEGRRASSSCYCAAQATMNECPVFVPLRAIRVSSRGGIIARAGAGALSLNHPGRRRLQPYNKLRVNPHAPSTVSCWAVPGVSQMNQVVSSATPVAGTPAQVWRSLSELTVCGPMMPSTAPG